MGRNLPAVDATGARIMGIDPLKVKHLEKASDLLGPMRETHIAQRGETIPPSGPIFPWWRKSPRIKDCAGRRNETCSRPQQRMPMAACSCVRCTRSMPRTACRKIR